MIKVSALALCLVTAAGHAQQRPPLAPDILRDYLSRAEMFGFSGAVVVGVGNTPILSGGFGLADRARGIPVTTTSPFYVASISKQFTAAAIMHMDMRGAVHTTDTLGRFFSGLPPDAARITVRQLLTHTAGTPRSDGAETDPVQYVRRLFAKPLRSVPGTTFAYSNEGYGVLAAIIQQVSGEPYGTYLHDQLFAPAGLTHTYDLGDAPASLVTRAYRGGNDMGDARLSLRGPIPWDERAGRGIITTAADLWKWELALRGTALLSPRAKGELFTPDREDYAYAWVVSRTARGTQYINHDGLIFPQGWNAQFRRFPDEGVVILALSNTFRREALSEIVARDLGRLIFGGAVRMPPAVRMTTAVERRKIAGSYEFPSGDRILIRETGGALTVEGESQYGINLLQFPNLRDTAALAGYNRKADEVLRALVADSLQRVRGLLSDAQSTEAWRAELHLTLDALSARYGPLKSASAIGSAAEDTAATDVQTFVRIRFARDSVVMRYSWRNARIIGASNMGSYPEGITEVERFPGAVPLAAAAAGGWVTYDLATGSARWFRLARDAAGRISGLEVRGADGSLLARRVAP